MAFRKIERLDEAGLKVYATKLLAGRSMSIGDLRAKLRPRAANPSDVETVVALMKEYGVVDDKKYAEHFAAVRRDSRGLGKQRALSDLMKKRVAGGVAKKAVEAAYAGTDETALIEAYLARKYRGGDLGQKLGDPKVLASVYRRLRIAGFSSNSSIRVLKRYASEAERLEELEDADPE